MDIGSAIAGSAVGGGLALAGGLMQNQANQANAQDARDFQLMMSNTAHQREVADLKAAGLNPILSANSGASSAPGPMAQSQNALGSAVGSAMDALKLQKDIEGTGSQIALNKAQSGAATAAALRDTSTAKEAGVRTDVLNTQMDAIKAKAQYDKGQAEWDTKMMKYDNINKRVNSGLGTVKTAVEAGTSALGYHPNTGEIKAR